MAIRQVPATDLAVGMYVSQLDRPWLETPFLFQGFMIKSAEEIVELGRYCKSVYVDDAPAAASADAARGSTGSGTATPERSVAALQSLPGSFYRNELSVVAEAARAKAVHAEATRVVADVMESIRHGERMDLHTVESVVERMMESVLRNQDAIAWLARIRDTDDYTYAHSVTCSIYAIVFGRHLGLPKEDLQVLGLGALLLDVGKTQIPKNLLLKPAQLSEEERELMHTHVEHGVAIVRELHGVDERVLAMVRSHHERYDGSGYPDGLKGPDIPVFARIAGIVDFYAALTAQRPYAAPISSYDATRELHRCARGEFQPEMVEHFVQAIGMFPNGVLVELSTGEVGIVIEQNRIRRLRPRVLVILDADKQPRAQLRIIDLKDLPSDPKASGAIWIERGLEPGAHGLDPADYYL